MKTFHYLLKFVRPLCCIAALSFGGCAVVDSIDAKIKEHQRKEDDARFATANSACVKYGFRVGTDSYAQCVQTEVNQIKNRQAIKAASETAAEASEKAAEAFKKAASKE